MLYNRFAQHVVDDKKKMYKRGSQWVVASAFALAIGGFGVTQTQTVRAAETQPQLTVQSIKEVHKTDASTPSSAASSQAAQAQEATVSTAQTAAPAEQKVASTTSVQVAQPASAAAKAATAAVQTNAPAPSSVSMTDEQWKAAKAKYDQAKADAAKQEADAKTKTEAAKSAYGDNVVSQAEAQKEKDDAEFEKLQSDEPVSLAAKKAAQANSYAAASQAAANEIKDLNSQRVTPNIQVGDGGTFNYVARTGAWSNIVSPNDEQNKTWDGGYLVQNLSVFTDDQVNSIDKLDPLSNPADRKPFDNYSDKADLEHMSDDMNTPSWVLSDTVQNDQLSAAQKVEVNQYAMMLINNYRKALGIAPLVSTESFLALGQERSDSMRTDTDMHHNAEAIKRIFAQYGGGASECIANANPNGYKGTRNGSLTMVEVLQAVADDINGMLNWDGDSNEGHREILLGEDGDVTGGFAIQKIADNEWVLNFNGVRYSADGKNIATVPEKDTSLPVDNNHEIDTKIEQIKDNLAKLQQQQAKDYQSAQQAYVDAQKVIYARIANDDVILMNLPQKIRNYNAQQDAALAELINSIEARVAKLDPGPEPNTPASGGSSSTSGSNSSSASSAASSATSSAASSAASGSSSSAASSANNSTASSAASSATSSAANSADSSASSSATSSANSSSASSASSAASSATSSAASSAASSASSSATSSAASPAASSAASSATSSASSSAASSANSSAASRATVPAATTPAGSNAPKPATGPAKPATVTPLVKTEPASTQPLSRMTQKYGKHAYPATGESQNGIVLAEAGALIIAVLGFAGVRKYHHAK
ncbi:SEC10/PgrA surface exclusion domain-containing protein [Lacticaseibacillus casei]|uniref:SEC10/PgrA surface exclusion domain-containing protein n=1 Tax=Lacticaseibacillus casei TaxID=1582 RepID=UPI00237D4938|nr:SEC10/PgrA surface exclusion domain-containing protein [Lacticaseibacillus casei]MDE3283479.1 SEC10/PgrA surface exclusion domain-containing protein [Lacticaseibacillus casei]